MFWFGNWGETSLVETGYRGVESFTVEDQHVCFFFFTTSVKTRRGVSGVCRFGSRSGCGEGSFT